MLMLFIEKYVGILGNLANNLVNYIKNVEILHLSTIGMIICSITFVYYSNDYLYNINFCAMHCIICIWYFIFHYVT